MMRWVMTMLGAGMLACGGSDPVAETSMDTSAGAGGGRSTPAGVSAGGSASSERPAEPSNMPACASPEPEVLLEGNMKGLLVRDDAAYFVDQDDGPVRDAGFSSATPSGVIRRLDLASRAVTTLYTPVEEELIVDFALWDDDLVLLLEGPVRLTFNLYLVPVAGGERRKIGPDDGVNVVYLGYGLLGTSGDELYFHGASSETLSAFSRTGAPPRTLVADLGLSPALQVVGQRLWYSTDEGRTEQGAQSTLYSRDLAPGSTPMEVYPDGCPIGSNRFQVTEAGIVCGNSQNVTLLALDGSGSTAVVDVPIVSFNPRSVLPSHTDGRSVYFAGSVFGLQFELGSKQTSFYTCDPAAVDAIGTTANSVIWGRTSGDGLLAGNVKAERTSFDAILRLAK